MYNKEGNINELSLNLISNMTRLQIIAVGEGESEFEKRFVHYSFIISQKPHGNWSSCINNRVFDKGPLDRF